MGIKDKLKAFGQHLAGPYPEGRESSPQPITSNRKLPWPQQSPEEKEHKRQQKEQEQRYKFAEAQQYRAAYHQGRLAGARKRGYREGQRSGSSGGHGIGMTLGNISKGMNQAGDFGQQMQRNLGTLFGIEQPKQKKKR